MLSSLCYWDVEGKGWEQVAHGAGGRDAWQFSEEKLEAQSDAPAWWLLL